MHIVENNIDDLLRASFEALLEKGNNCSGTKGSYRELIGVTLELTNPRARLSRTETKGHVYSCLGELFWYLSGKDDAEFISYYVNEYLHYTETDNTIAGAYGPRMFGMEAESQQFKQVLELVKKKQSTRQAVIQIFDSGDLTDPPKKDIPCTLTLQFLLRDDVLHLVVSMRSNDAYKGLPHDLFCFTMLQELFAVAISTELGKEIRLGTYKHFVSSFHVYDKDLANVETFFGEGFTATSEIMPPMPDNSYSQLGQVLSLEEKIRLGHNIDLNELQLSSYWSELITLLKIFSIYRSDSSCKDKVRDIEQVAKKLVTAGYKQFIHKKLERLRADIDDE